MSDTQIHATLTIGIVIAREGALEGCRELIAAAPGTAPDPDRAIRLGLTGELVHAVTWGLSQSQVADALGPPRVRVDVGSGAAPADPEPELFDLDEVIA